MIRYEKRHYPYDLELDTKYREYTANNLQKTPLNYKEQATNQKPLEGSKPKDEKMNQIQTLNHHGRRRRTERSGTTAVGAIATHANKVPNGDIASKIVGSAGQFSVDLPDGLENFENRNLENSKNKEDIETMSNPSRADEFSFTLPKPQNISCQKVKVFNIFSLKLVIRPYKL